MRHKDEHKKEAIFDAAIALINSIGFSETSMSKIARKAKVSPATIYIYFESKEDMLNKIFMRVKEELSKGLMEGVYEEMPLKERFRKLWKNMFYAFISHPAYFHFVEQFSNSPLINKLVMQEAHSHYQALYDLYDRGRLAGMIKEQPVQLIAYFSFLPIIDMAKDHLSGAFNLSEDLLEQAIEIAWDAITVN